MTFNTQAIDARAVFRSTFGESQNFMTPEVVSYEIHGRYAVELSRGTAFDPGRSLYGVTVLELDGTRTDLGAVFDRPEDALDYIKELD